MTFNLKSFFSFLILLLVISSCTLSSSNFEHKLKWLTGTWHTKYKKIIAQEKWYWNEEDEEFCASGFMINEKDTVYSQSMKIHEENNELFLSVHSQDHSNEKEAFFKLIRYDADSLVFKNIFNVNPKFIIYSNQNPYLHTKAIVEKKGHTELDIRKYEKLESIK